MASKKFIVRSTTNEIYDLSILIAPRKGDIPVGFSEDGFIHLDFIWHKVDLDKWITIDYGDDMNPYIDGLALNVSSSTILGNQQHFSNGGERGNVQDNALNMYDTFTFRISKDGLDLFCENSNGSGGTVQFQQ